MKTYRRRVDGCEGMRMAAAARTTPRRRKSCVFQLAKSALAGRSVARAPGSCLCNQFVFEDWRIN